MNEMVLAALVAENMPPGLGFYVIFGGELRIPKERRSLRGRLENESGSGRGDEARG